MVRDDESYLVFCAAKIIPVVDRSYDVKGSHLAYMVGRCLMQNGKLTRLQREQFQHIRREPVCDLIESLSQHLLYRQGAMPIVM
jgi:hypothetical protein